MSIVKTRNFLERSSCGLIVSIVLGITFIIGFIAVTRGNRDYGAQSRGGVVLFHVGDLTVNVAMMDALTRENSPLGGQDIEARPVRDRTRALAGVVQSVVRLGYALSAAQKAKIELGNTKIKNSLVSLAREEVYAKYRGMGATTEVLAKADQVKQEVAAKAKNYAAAWDDDNLSDYVKAKVAEMLLRESFANKVSPTDDELKHCTDELSFRIINFTPTGGKSGDMEANIAKVQSEIAKDGFSKVADRYAATPSPLPGVSANKTPTPARRMMLLAMPELSDVAQLKAGETSKPTSSGDAKILFNLVSVKENPSKDFEKEKADLKQLYIDTLASGQLNKAVADQEGGVKIKWEDKGYQLLYKWTKAPPTFEAQKAIADEAENLASGAPDARVISLVRFASFDAAWSVADPKQKRDYEKQRIDVLRDVLSFAEDSSLRLELADLLIEEKKGPEALGELKDAADFGVDFTDETKKRFDDVDLRVKKLLAEKLIKPEEAAYFQKARDKWLQQKAENDKEQAAIAAKKAVGDKQLQEQHEQYDKMMKQKAEAKKGEQKPEPSKGGTEPKSGPAQAPGK